MSLRSKNSIAVVSTATVITAVLGYVSYKYYFEKKIKEKKKNNTTTTTTTTTTVEAIEIETIDLSLFVNKNKNPELCRQECAKVARCLHETGVLIVKDPNVNEADNDKFVDLMEQYFEQSDGSSDARPEWHYQVGVTPSHTERPRNHCQRAAKLPKEHQPITLCPPELDPKWRFFWRIGERPKNNKDSKFQNLNMDDVVPEHFPEWSTTMNMWGNKMIDTLKLTSQMAACGMDLPENTFTDMMSNGPHLLAPTGSDFNKHGRLNTVLAGYHYDLNFLTIHGKSRYPGLYVWLRDGRKVQVKVPKGCLIIQAGKQCEILTAGYVQAGFHEVVVTPQTMKVIAEKKKLGKSLWRVSSTLFGHINSEATLQPLGKFAKSESANAYPPVYAGDQVLNELKAINLSSEAG